MDTALRYSIRALELVFAIGVVGSFTVLVLTTIQDIQELCTIEEMRELFTRKGKFPVKLKEAPAPGK